MSWTFKINNIVLSSSSIKIIDILSGHEDAILELLNNSINRGYMTNTSNYTLEILWGSTSIWWGRVYGGKYKKDGTLLIKGYRPTYKELDEADLTADYSAGETCANILNAVASASGISAGVAPSTSIKVKFVAANCRDIVEFLAQVCETDYYRSGTNTINIGDKGSNKGSISDTSIVTRKDNNTSTEMGIDRAKIREHVKIRGFDDSGNEILGQAYWNGSIIVKGSSPPSPLPVYTTFDREGKDTTTLDNKAADILEEMRKTTSGSTIIVPIDQAYNIYSGDDITINDDDLGLSGSYEVMRIDKDIAFAEINIDRKRLDLEDEILDSKRYENLGIYYTIPNLDDIPDGTTYNKTTVNQVTGADRAYNYINANYDFIGAIAPGHSATVAGSGLYMGDTHMGYSDGVSWKAYINSDGDFYFGGDSLNFIQWTTLGGILTVRGLLYADDILLSGSTYLADWRHPDNLSMINGGNIFARSIWASHLYAGILDNFIDNGSFEDWDDVIPRDWVHWAGLNRWYKYTTDPKHGDNALRGTAASEGRSIRFNVKYYVSEGETVTVKWWQKRTSTTGYAGTSIEWRDINDNHITSTPFNKSTTDLPSTDTWYEFTGNGIAPANTVYCYIYCVIRTSSVSDYWYWDNVRAYISSKNIIHGDPDSYPLVLIDNTGISVKGDGASMLNMYYQTDYMGGLYGTSSDLRLDSETGEDLVITSGKDLILSANPGEFIYLNQPVGIITTGAQAAAYSGVTRYLSFSIPNVVMTSETEAEMVVGHDCVASSMMVRVRSNNNTTGPCYVKLMKNGSPTTLGATVTTGFNGNFSGGTEVELASGDRIYVRVDNSLGDATMIINSVTLMFGVY